MADQPTVIYPVFPPGGRPTPPPIPTNPPIVPNTDSPPIYVTNPNTPIYPIRPPLPTQGGGGDGGGGGDNHEPAKPAPSQTSSDSESTASEGNRPEQTATTSSPSSQQQQTSPPSSTGNGGGVTLQPGAPTAFRNTIPTTTSEAAPGISGSVIAGPMTAVVFTFAFLGALIIGLVAGFLIAKYTRLGGSRKRKEQKDQLTEQLRLLTENIGQQNEYNHYYRQRHPQERPFNLDRSYLQEGKLPNAPFQAELAPLYLNQPYTTYPATTTADAAAMDLPHPQLAPDQHNLYQDWDSAGTPLMTPGTPMVSIRPAIVPTSAAFAAAQAAAASRTPRMGNITTTPPPPDIEIDGPKDEWASSRAGSTISLSSKNVSASDLSEFQRKDPQHREAGVGEDSLFGDGLDFVSHNPHSLSRID
ncbi:hypothetical protein BGZ96_003929 [Linnemannia gamsii]|uniref:Uncharacterized protein n=1 Tax=Linnemannia gamsii TaxID=64522 RepID=A0ABQ7KF02_9FUNG|nr:hypothetical protein BGZ96_003929 [Linnemannia gamsii]